MNSRNLSYTILFSLLSFFCFCIVYNANWNFCNAGDDYQFLMTTAIGKCSHGATWASRFWPLGLSDYSILLLFKSGKGVSALAHYIHNCVILIVSSLAMFFLLLKKTKKNCFISLLSVILLFLSTDFLQIHMYCIYPERMLFCIFCLFMLFVDKAMETQKTYWFLFAFIISAYSIYMKELVFVVFLAISILELSFGNLSKKTKIFHVSMLLNAMIFVVIYGYRRIFLTHKNAYASVISSISDISFAQFINEPILFLIVGLALFRGCIILLKKDELSFADSCLFASVGYAFSYFLLKLYSAYYFIPAIVLFLPAFAIFIDRIDTIRVLAVIVLFFVCLNFNHIKNKVTDAWKHRKTDQPVFEYIIKKNNEKQKVYWLTDDPNFTLDIHDTPDFFYLNRLHLFLKFYNNGSDLPITVIQDMPVLDENCVIIHSDGKSFEKIKQSENLNVKKIEGLNFVTIFECSK